MRMILFLAVVIGLGVGGWQVCDNTTICYPEDASKVPLAQVVAEVAGVSVDASAGNAAQLEEQKKNKLNENKDESKEESKEESEEGNNPAETDSEDSGDEGVEKDKKEKDNGNKTDVASTDKDTNKTVTCDQPYLTAQIRVGRTNDKAAVIKLEKFLNEFEGEKLIAGGKYDATDVAAVKRFQEKYKAEILTPYGLNSPTGEVMKSTLAQINKLYCAGKK